MLCGGHEADEIAAVSPVPLTPCKCFVYFRSCDLPCGASRGTTICENVAALSKLHFDAAASSGARIPLAASCLSTC